MAALTLRVPRALPSELHCVDDMPAVQGSGGTVELCLDASGRRVVLKRPRAELAHEGEMHMAARHATAASPGGRGVIQCERVAGGLLLPFRALGDVQQCVARTGVPPEGRVRDVMRDVLQGLVGCHQAGLAHLDVKPENVLLTSDGGELCDFGAAAWLPCDAPYCGPVHGTLRALSPDAFLSAAAPSPGFDARAADVWGAGVVLYTLLTGACFLSEVCNEELCGVMSGLADGAAPFPPQAATNAVNKARRELGAADDAPLGAVALLRALLTIDPVRRPTASEALARPWFSQKEPRRVRARLR